MLASKWSMWLIVFLLVAACVFAFGIVNILVSLKYETDAPAACISQVTGVDLCAQLFRTKLYALFAFVSAVLLFLARIVGRKH